MPSRIAVLASGRGSNLRVLLDYFAHASRRELGSVALVASDKPDAGALEVAREHAIDARSLEVGDAHAPAMVHAMREHEIDLVVLAGFLRLIPSLVVRAYEGRMVNVHPALLPAFGGKGMYGGRVHRAVIAAGVRISGPTVHFVDELYDHGAIIAQWPVPVLEDDTEQTLAARVLYAEHRLLPRVVHALCARQVRWGPRGVAGASPGITAERVFALGERTALEPAMDLLLGLPGD
jgi:formyltetrahydrofolate-dependent phosphoribosylglycinamide formyltransferase